MTSGDFEKAKYYELFINNGNHYSTYWMSSRCVLAGATSACFSVYVVKSGIVYADSLCFSSDRNDFYSYALRPVITLNSNVQVTSGDGSEGTPFEIN